MANTWTRYELVTHQDGRITGLCSTNDDKDDGSGDEYSDWRVSFRDHAEMLARTGGTHYGFTGCKVDVVLDGNYVPAPRRVPGVVPAAVALLLALLVGCTDDGSADGWDTGQFRPHKASTWSTTPAGHARDAGPFASVESGHVTEVEIDAAIDAGFARFWSAFPEFGRPTARVHLTEDYVFWYAGQWAAGANEGQELLLPLFARGTSSGDPGAQFIKRAPDGNYSWWRFTTEPLVPALAHELLHRCIGDPQHGRAEWSRIPGATSKAGEVSSCAGVTRG